MNYDIDLHIHSVLSPCADLLMTMENVFKKLEENNIKIFSITDHNSCKNSHFFSERAKKRNMLFIPGVEIQSSEEIHILGYFKDIEDLKKVCDEIYINLPPIKNKEDIFGYQLILDEEDDFVEKEEAFLSGACMLGIDEVYDLIKSNNGIVVPAHIDRSSSIIENLGYIPDLDFDGFEIFFKRNINEMVKKYSLNKPIFSSSDSHSLDTLKNAKMEIEMKEFNIESFFEAVKKGELRTKS